MPLLYGCQTGPTSGAIALIGRMLLLAPVRVYPLASGRAMNKRAVAWLLLVLVVVAVGDTFADAVPPQSASAPQPAHDLPRLREWIDAVDRHIPGQPDGAAIDVASWSRAELEGLVLDLQSLLQLITTPDRPRFPRALRAFTPRERQELQDLAVREAQRVANYPASRRQEITEAGAKRAVNRLLKRATLLHTDVALLVPATADRTDQASAPVPRSLLAPRSSVQVLDGRQVGVTYYGTHWDLARLLLDELIPYPAGDGTVRQWYRAVAAVFARLAIPQPTSSWFGSSTVTTGW